MIRKRKPNGTESDCGVSNDRTTSKQDKQNGKMEKATTTQNPSSEKKAKKIFLRVFFGAILILTFSTCVYMGHLYVCGLVAIVETLLFRELVRVRYNTYLHIIEDTIPLFRTTQWLWFLVAIFYTYSDFIVFVIKNNRDLHHLFKYAKWQPVLTFSLYAITFVITICTLQPGHIRFQMNQLCWTVVVLCLTVGQLKYVMHNVFNGLFWFAFPILIVVTNDCFAYFSGVAFGRKFINRTFFALSPNKTWEGFIGAGFCTITISWFLAKRLAQSTWMTCPTNEFNLFPDELECDVDPIFLEARNIFSPHVFDLFPAAIVKMIPGIMDICTVDGDINSLTTCIRDDPSHTHHHFTLVVKSVLPIQWHALLLGAFASLVAPFGGFLASAIKRAYKIKDFDSIIPGHGGVMDRFDCQLLMALCTWVHYNTFVGTNTVSVSKMIYQYKLLREADQIQFLDEISQLSN